MIPYEKAGDYPANRLRSVLLMGIFDRMSDASRGVSEKMANLSEVQNLKRKILYEEERIVEIFADLGKKYYKNPDEDPAVFRAL